MKHKDYHKSLLIIIALGLITIVLIWLPNEDFFIYKTYKKTKKQSSIDRGLEAEDPYAQELESIYRYHEKLMRFHSDLANLSKNCSVIVQKIVINPKTKKVYFPVSSEELDKFFKLLFQNNDIHNYRYRKFDLYNMAFYPPEGFKINKATKLIRDRFECHDYQSELLDHAVTVVRNPQNKAEDRRVLLNKILKFLQEHLRTITNVKELYSANQILKKLSERQLVDSGHQYAIVALTDEISYYVDELDFDAKFDPSANDSKELFALLKAEYEMSRNYAKKMEELLRDISVDLSYPL